MSTASTLKPEKPTHGRSCVLYYRERPSEPEPNAAAIEQQNRIRAAFEANGATVVATFNEIEASTGDLDMARPMFERAFQAAVDPTNDDRRVELVVLRVDPIGSGARFRMNSPGIKQLEAQHPLVSVTYQGCEGLERQLEHEWRYATGGDDAGTDARIAGIVMRCVSCRSTDVKRDAWAVWDTAAQNWVLGSVFDDAHCETCGRTTVEAVEHAGQSPRLRSGLQPYGRSSVRGEQELGQAMVPPGAGASFAATRHAGLARIEPLTAAAEQWLRAHVGSEASWDGDALVVELRYFPELADAIIDAGFTFERDALPN